MNKSAVDPATQTDTLAFAKLVLNHGSGTIPALGFGTLIPDAAATISGTRDALEAGFRHFDCAERYRNEINRIQTRQRLNAVVKTGMPGFIPQGS